MAIPIKTAALLTGSLFAAGCASGQADGLNPKNKLHCAVVLGVAGQNAERTNAPAEARRAFFVGNSWYTQRLPERTLETSEAKQALALARQDLAALEPIAKACIDRATREAGFKGFRRRIGAMYDEADAARR
ncbi:MULTISPECIES: hypothetical protein [unclassified Sphingomonas]|uniref:hypothetical protein n=1 Tax=unclassified Sphingomonas TaxID=196159 RepID=UPI0022B3003E|nr:hypothetical protein [Sphingomonas sp. NIBR02145]WHU03244.1 hypothetical protein O3305_01115 [Sphingomonas sp. NIBR02145]